MRRWVLLGWLLSRRNPANQEVNERTTGGTAFRHRCGYIVLAGCTCNIKLKCSLASLANTRVKSALSRIYNMRSKWNLPSRRAHKWCWTWGVLLAGLKLVSLVIGLVWMTVKTAYQLFRDVEEMTQFGLSFLFNLLNVFCEATYFVWSVSGSFLLWKALWMMCGVAAPQQG